MATPGGACIFTSVNGLHLETPSAMQREHVHGIEEKHMKAGKLEARSKSLRELTAAEMQEKERRMGPRIVRKKAKGPNPLSIKKGSKTKQSTSGIGGGGGGGGGEASRNQHKERQQSGSDGEGKQKRRKRRRRKDRESGGGADTGGVSD